MLAVFWKPFLIAGIVSLGVQPAVIWFFRKKGWMENIKEKQRKLGNVTAIKPVPRGAGLGIFLGVTLALTVSLKLDKHMAGVIWGALLLLIVGLRDDVRDVSPKIRLLANFLAAGLVVASGIGIALVSNPLGGVIDLSWPRWQFFLAGRGHEVWFLADFLAVVWIVYCTNAVGWATGVQGQLPGFAIISALVIGILGLKFSQDITQWPVIILAGAVAGAYTGFLPYNFFPQKMQPGYSGKSLAGYFLAVLAILSGAKLATVILVLGIPVLDAAYVGLGRLKKRKVPWKGGAEHFHHLLLKTGWSQKKVTLFYWAVSAGLGAVALCLNSRQKFYTLIGLGLVLGYGIDRLNRVKT